MPKIAFVGAGSATFSVGVVRDICLQESLAGSVVTLMDINRQRLELMHKFGQRYAGELGADVKFEMTTDREAAQRVRHTPVLDLHPGLRVRDLHRSLGRAGCEAYLGRAVALAQRVVLGQRLPPASPNPFGEAKLAK